MTKDNGGPAFPMPATEEHLYNQSPLEAHYGMTLRDYFAGMVLQGLSSRQYTLDMDYDVMAIKSYKIADAMLAERGKS